MLNKMVLTNVNIEMRKMDIGWEVGVRRGREKYRTLMSSYYEVGR